MFRTLISIFSLLMGMFLFFFFRRICTTFFPSLSKRTAALICAALALAGAAAAAFGGLSMVITVYLFGFGLCWQLIDLAVRTALRRRQKALSIWKKIHGSGALTLLPTAALVLAGYLSFQSIVCTQYTVYTQKDIRAEGYRIALISDVHFSDMLGRERLAQACDEIAAANADAVILCGDIVDDATDLQGLQTVFELLGDIPSRFGTYYVYGNHDHPSFLKFAPFSAEQLHGVLAQNGITLLCDEAVPLGDEITLIGRDDRLQPERATVETLVQKVPQHDLLIMLEHRPHEYTLHDAAGVDLVLSGHTHGGQLFPLNLLMRIIPFNDGIYGHYTLPHGTQTVVSSGLAGWGFPIKNAAPCEYVLVDILPQ